MKANKNKFRDCNINTSETGSKIKTYQSSSRPLRKCLIPCLISPTQLKLTKEFLSLCHQIKERTETQLASPESKDSREVQALSVSCFCISLYAGSILFAAWRRTWEGYILPDVTRKEREADLLALIRKILGRSSDWLGLGTK